MCTVFNHSQALLLFFCFFCINAHLEAPSIKALKHQGHLMICSRKQLLDLEGTLSPFLKLERKRGSEMVAAKGLVSRQPCCKDPQNPERNRGFAFVEYYNHACAEQARRALSSPGFKLGTNTPTINWADSPSGLDNPASSQVKVVYVRNLPDTATQEQVWKLFEHHGEITKVMLPQSKPGQQKRDFGFVHFADRSSALKAIEKTEKYVLHGRELECSLAKPPAADKKPGAMAMQSPFASGILPQAFPSRPGFGFSGPDMYGGMAMGFGATRGFGQVQPVIYGRGPTPAGMAMVPMMLPDGRIGYVLQQAGVPPPAAASYNRDGRGGGRGQQSQKQGGSSSSRRFSPY